MFCIRCGGELKEGENFCGSCGMPIMDSQQPFQTQEAPISTSIKTQEKKGISTRILVSGIVVASVIMMCVLLGYETHYRVKAKKVWREKASQEEYDESDASGSDDEINNYMNDYTQGDQSF